MGFTPTTSKDKDTGKKIFTFSLRLPELIGLTVIILVGFVWVFIFGLLVGRGYQPEEALPELKHLMPAQQQVAEANPMPVEQNIGANSSAQPNKTSNALPLSATQATHVTEQQKASVIKPEQLNFFEQLKAKEAPNSPAIVSNPKKAHVVAKRPTPTPVVTGKVAPKPNVVVASDPSGKKRSALEKNAVTFEYIYQVAASTNKEAASKLRSTMSTKGFTTSLATAVIDTKKWYRVNVHFIGSPADLSGFKSRLAVAGYNKPLLKKKKQR